jgi:hypothetical protein
MTLVHKFLAADDLPLGQRVKMSWTRPLQTLSMLVPDGDGQLFLSADIRSKNVDGNPAGTDLVRSIEKFQLFLFDSSSPQLTVHFDHLRFSSSAGKKSEVDVAVDKIEFGGVLGFIETLASLIPGDGFEGPELAVDDTGITANFSIPLPSIGVGVFSLQNIALGAGLNIPFIGKPMSMSFDFCTRENPFVLTVMAIGGGGFVGITLDANGLQSVEAQLEAGAELDIDLGVASGSVSAMVGVYFALSAESVTVTGFFKIHGEVDVLGGLFSAALTLDLELTYSNGKLTGTASMEVEVHIIFFSVSVTVSCQETLAGANGDPSFGEAMAPDGDYRPWEEYVLAFAA